MKARFNRAMVLWLDASAINNHLIIEFSVGIFLFLINFLGNKRAGGSDPLLNIQIIHQNMKTLLLQRNKPYLFVHRGNAEEWCVHTILLHITAQIWLLYRNKSHKDNVCCFEIQIEMYISQNWIIMLRCWYLFSIAAVPIINQLPHCNRHMKFKFFLLLSVWKTFARCEWYSISFIA